MLDDDDSKWPFVRFSQGAFIGLIVIMIVSDFIFQKRMIFGPIFVFCTIAIFYQVILLVIASITNDMNLKEIREWVMLFEGTTDMMV